MDLNQFTTKAQQAVFDAQRLAALRRLSVDHLPFCQDCFCKWHCAGDCLSKALESSRLERHDGTARCKINRALTLAWLQTTVEQASEAPVTP